MMVGKTGWQQICALNLAPTLVVSSTKEKISCVAGCTAPYLGKAAHKMSHVNELYRRLVPQLHRGDLLPPQQQYGVGKGGECPPSKHHVTTPHQQRHFKTCRWGQVQK